MELPSLDLNLIVVLHALLEERNVTRAGERVGLSQPGTSSALARLRRHFDDQLLERVGNRYELTPLASGLAVQVGRTLEDLQALLAAQPKFDPATAERRFVVACSDSVLTVIGPAVIRAVAEAAPHTILDFRAVPKQTVTDPMAALGEVDVLVVPRGLFLLPDVPGVELYRDRWICATNDATTRTADPSAADSANPTLTFEQAARARWIIPFHEMVLASPADAALTALGVDRRCSVRVENFTVLDRLLAVGGLYALLHERTAGDLSARGLRPVPLPVELPPIVETVWAHPGHRLDPGHRWFVDLLLEQARTLPVPDASTPTDPA